MCNSYRKLTKTVMGAVLVASIYGCGSNNDVIGGGGGIFAPVTPISPILRAPIANDDNINAIGNATLNQALGAGVLLNDELNGATISSFDSTSANGGTVNLSADGSFTYTPAAGFSGPDTFTYTLTNALGSSTATVNLSVNGRAFFVDTSLAANGSGAQNSPFNTLASALNVVASGDTIFVFGTSGPINGAINLPQGVNLIGQGVGLILAQQIEPVGTRPTLSGPITPGGGNTISGFSIDGSGTSGITANNVTDLTITGNVFDNHTVSHVVLTDVSGDVNISGNVFDSLANTGTQGLDLDNAGTNANYLFENNQFNDDSGTNKDNVVGLFSGTSVVSLVFRNNTVSTDYDLSGLFQLTGAGTSQVTVNASGNTLAALQNTGLSFETQSAGASINATVTNNFINEPSTGLLALTSGGTIDLTCTGNNFETCNTGIDLQTAGTSGSINATISNNRFFECSPAVRGVADGTSGNITVAVRDNQVDRSLNFRTENTGVICADITGNTFQDNGGDVDFTNNGTAINVERLDNSVVGGPLDAVNLFELGTVDLNGTTVTPQDAGFCQIP